MKNRFEIRDDVTEIFLRRLNGDILETLIDTQDLDRATEFPNTWCAMWSADTNSFYCFGKVNGTSVLLHRWLTRCPDHLQVDHFDNDTLNNRQSINLRVASLAENLQNRSGAQRNSQTGIRGVSWNARKRKWQTHITANKKRLFLGYFSDIEAANSTVQQARRSLMPFSKEASL